MQSVSKGKLSFLVTLALILFSFTPVNAQQQLPLYAELNVGTPYKSDGSPDSAYQLNAVFTRDSNYIIAQGRSTISEHNSIQKWNIHTGQKVEEAVPMLGQSPVIDISPDGTKVALGTYTDSYDIFLVNVDPLSLIQRIDAHNQRIYGVAFTPDSSQLLTASFHDYTAFLWNLSNYSQVWSLTGDAAHWENHTISPDGSVYASSNRDDIKIGSMSNGGQLQILDHQTFDSSWGAQVDLAFSTDGSVLASSGTLGTVKLWNTSSWQQLESWQIGGQLNSIEFYPNSNNIIITNNRNSTAYVFDMLTGQTLYTFANSQSPWDVAVSDDGKYVLSTHVGAGLVRIWELPDSLGSSLPTATPTPSIVPTNTPTPTATPTPTNTCRADANSNGTVEIGDISAILFYWGQSCTGFEPACVANANGSTTIEVGDIAAVLFEWGNQCLD